MHCVLKWVLSGRRHFIWTQNGMLENKFCSIKFRSKHSIVLVLCLLRNLMLQTLSADLFSVTKIFNPLASGVYFIVIVKKTTIM